MSCFFFGNSVVLWLKVEYFEWEEHLTMKEKKYFCKVYNLLLNATERIEYC